MLMFAPRMAGKFRLFLWGRAGFGLPNPAIAPIALLFASIRRCRRLGRIAWVAFQM